MRIVNPPAGFRDFGPEEMILRKKVIKKIEDTFITYGFDPIETPVLEYWDLLKGKYGEEAENRLIYFFKDPWSEKWYALRYDLTVPLARFLAKKTFSMPFKRYHIGRVWRHDRPQRARYREFWQADADIIGSKFPEADAEVINLTIDALRRLGFDNFEILVNDRVLIESLISDVCEEKEKLVKIFRIIDKLDKIGEFGVKSELEKIGLERDDIEKIFQIISFKGDFNSLQEYLSGIAVTKHKDAIDKALARLDFIDSLLNDRSKVYYSLSLVRGLDYYTGPIWEVKIRDVEFPSVGGGGRYDELINLIAGKDMPATGTSIGIDRIIDAGLELGLFNLKERTYTKVAIICIERSLFKQCWEIANTLRQQNISTFVDLMRRKESKQREYANKRGIRFLIMIGSRELEKGQLVLIDKETNDRVEVPMERIHLEILRRIREKED